MSYVDEVKDGKAQLVDVRSKLEWRLGHADGAVHISLGSLSSGHRGDLDQAKPVYVYCASGARSAQAESILKREGFKVTNIGGLSSWQAAGGAVTRK